MFSWEADSFTHSSTCRQQTSVCQLRVRRPLKSPGVTFHFAEQVSLHSNTQLITYSNVTSFITSPFYPERNTNLLRLIALVSVSGRHQSACSGLNWAVHQRNKTDVLSWKQIMVIWKSTQKPAKDLSELSFGFFGSPSPRVIISAWSCSCRTRTRSELLGAGCKWQGQAPHDEENTHQKQKSTNSYSHQCC